jgi:hypothetical protein
MTLQLLHSEFPYIWGKFDFLFYQCALGEFGKWHLGWGREYRKDFFTVYSTCHSVEIKYACSNPQQVYIKFNCSTIFQISIAFSYHQNKVWRQETLVFRITTRSPSKIWRWFTKSAQFLICKVNRSSLFKLDFSCKMRSVCWKISRHCPCPRYAA